MPIDAKYDIDGLIDLDIRTAENPLVRFGHPRPRGRINVMPVAPDDCDHKYCRQEYRDAPEESVIITCLGCDSRVAIPQSWVNQLPRPQLAMLRTYPEDIFNYADEWALLPEDIRGEGPYYIPKEEPTSEPTARKAIDQGDKLIHLVGSHVEQIAKSLDSRDHNRIRTLEKVTSRTSGSGLSG